MQARSRMAGHCSSALLLGMSLALAPGARVVARPIDPPAVEQSLFEQLADAIRTAPEDQFGAPQFRKHLLLEVRHAEDAVEDSHVCSAEEILAGMRRHLLNSDEERGDEGKDAGDRPKVSPSLAATLEADILSIEGLLFSQSGSEKCGGARQPASTVDAPVVTVVSADNTQMTFHVSFPPPRFAARWGNGRAFLQMFMPGMGSVSSLFIANDRPGGSVVGLPELPGVSERLAVPQGGTLTVEVLDSSSYELPAVRVWPAQPPTPAAVAGSPRSVGLPPPPPFTVNSRFYASSASWPAEPIATGPVHPMRGLPIGSIALAGAQYVPSAGRLRVFTGMDVRVAFGGDSHNVFGTTRLFDPGNGPFIRLWRNNVLNWNSVGQWVARLPPPLPCGEEMIVITSPTDQLAADTFAADRTAHGILAKVFVTGQSANADPGDIGITPKGILAFIAQEYDNPTCIRPAYVQLVGDTTVVPTFEISLGFHTNLDGSTSPNFFEDPVATDMPYGFVHQQAQVDQAILSTPGATSYITDYSPDLFVGRLPGPSSGVLAGSAYYEANVINAYEDAAPAPLGSGFFQTVIGAEFFQPCPNIQTGCKDNLGNVQTSTQDRQPFLRSSEFVGTQAQGAGKTFVRVAEDEQNYDPGVTITPLTFDDGTPISPGIDFNGTAGDVASVIRNGSAFLIWHSDHGFTNGIGWYEPPFALQDLTGISAIPTLPVIWSSDCDSGKFDTELLASAPSLFPNVVGPGFNNFGETSLAIFNAVAFIGASRESPIYQDGYTLKGMGTSLFPEEGNVWRAIFGIPLQSPVRQVGPLLESAKEYMEAQTSADLVNDHTAQGTVLEYNLLGDPSMSIWRDPPTLYLGHLLSGVLDFANGQVVVRSAQAGVDGTLVTLVRRGVTLGQGVLAKGSATIAVAPRIDSLDGVKAVLANDGFVPATVALQAPPPATR